MSRIRIIALLLAAFAISALPALAGSTVCKLDKCSQCEVVFASCLAAAGTDAAKKVCEAQKVKCKDKCKA